METNYINKQFENNLKSKKMRKSLLDDDENESVTIINNTTNNEIKENKITVCQPKEYILGIDLGTRNCCVAVWRNNKVEIIPDEFGNRTFPSVIAFTEIRKYVGHEALKQLLLNPRNSYYDLKRLLGKKFSDESIKLDKKFLSYDLMQGENDSLLIQSHITHGRKKNYTPEELVALILLKLKFNAEKYLLTPINKVVITVPAYFNDSQREATYISARIAGLDCVRMINEPTSSALAYGLGLFQQSKSHEDEINVLVYDVGAGTTDASVLQIINGTFQVLASTGNTHLGGEDFDNKIMDYCLQQFSSKYKINEEILLSPLTKQQLKTHSEKAKKLLSVTTEAYIFIEKFYDEKNLEVKITRSEFENLCKDLFLLCMKSVQDALISSELIKDQINEILLVGGSTRIPKIQELIQLFFNKSPNHNVDPDEAVATGAAIQALLLSGEKNPFKNSITLLDITPLSLGIETNGGLMSVIVERNTAIPITKKKKYTTDTDNMESVSINVFEGERELVKDNFKIGTFELKGIQKAQRGVPEIEVSFDIDLNGIIKVTALDTKNLKNKYAITVTSSKNKLNEKKINELIEESNQYALEDRMIKEKKLLQYEIDELCYNILANISNPHFKLKENEKKDITVDIQKTLKKINELVMSEEKLSSTYEMNKDEYTNILEKLKKKYSTLILKTSFNDEIKFKEANTTNLQGTIIYGDDKQEGENEEIVSDVFVKKVDEKPSELEQYKQQLIDLCNNLQGILAGLDLKITESEKNDVKFFIDDTMIWIYVAEKITIDEIDKKIQEINQMCNSLTQKYQDIFVTNNVFDCSTKKKELEQLCLTLIVCLDSNYFTLNIEKTEKLKKKILDTLEWLKQNEENTQLTSDHYQQKIDLINQLSNEI